MYWYRLDLEHFICYLHLSLRTRAIAGVYVGGYTVQTETVVMIYAFVQVRTGIGQIFAGYFVQIYAKLFDLPDVRQNLGQF